MQFLHKTEQLKFSQPRKIVVFHRKEHLF